MLLGPKCRRYDSRLYSQTKVARLWNNLLSSVSPSNTTDRRMNFGMHVYLFYTVWYRYLCQRSFSVFDMYVLVFVVHDSYNSMWKHSEVYELIRKTEKTNNNRYKMSELERRNSFKEEEYPVHVLEQGTILVKKILTLSLSFSTLSVAFFEINDWF